MRQLRRASLVASALVLVGLAQPLLAGSSSWPSFRGPHGDGSLSQALPAGNGALRLEPRWVRPLGSGYSGITIGDGLIYSAAQVGSEDLVLAFDAETGDERWRSVLGPGYSGYDGSHDGPISTPALADGRVFALSPRGRLIAVDAANGHLLWSSELTEVLGAAKPYYGFASSPAVVGGLVVLHGGGTGGALAAFDATSGELRWRTFETGVDSQSPIVTELAGRRQIVAMGDKTLVGIDPQDGSILWSLEHAGSPAAMAAPSASPLPLGSDRLLIKDAVETTAVVEIAAAEDGSMVASRVHELRALAKSYSPPARSAQLAVGYTGRFLSAADPAVGQLLWKSREPGDGFLVTLDDLLVVLTKTGSLHLGTAEADGWREVDSRPVFAELAWTPPSLDGSRIYARSLGEIARVDVVRGKARGALEAVAPPAVLAPLVARLAAGEPGPAAVDAFLAGKTLPLVDGEEATFVWRGEAKDVAIGGEMIGMRRDEPMHRLDGTDLWWWSTRLDRHDRVSYHFYVDEKATLDPTHEHRVPSTILGPDLNWNRGGELELSSFAMPDWPGLRNATSPAEPTSRGRLETWSVEVTPQPQPDAPADRPAPAPVEVEIRSWLPPGYDPTGDRDYPVAFVLAGDALDHGGWQATLDRVVGSTVEPLIVAFVEPPDKWEVEETLFKTVVSAIDGRYRTSHGPARRALVAFGWWGTAATALAFTNPDQIGRLGLQSPYDGVNNQLRDTAADQPGTVLPPLAIYLEWGHLDLNSPHEAFDTRQGARDLDTFLRQNGWAPIGGEVWDSTDWGSWSNRTDLLLAALFPAAGYDVAPALAPWLTGK